MREAQIYKDYVEAIGQGAMTRRDAALYFGVHISTARYNLDKAVELGLLEKVYGWTDKHQTGWLYQVPENSPAFTPHF